MGHDKINNLLLFKGTVTVNGVVNNAPFVSCMNLLKMLMI